MRDRLLMDELNLIFYFSLDLRNAKEASSWGTMRDIIRRIVLDTMEYDNSEHYFQMVSYSKSQTIKWEWFTWTRGTILSESVEHQTWKLTPLLPQLSSTSLRVPWDRIVTLHDTLFRFDKSFIYREDLETCCLRPRKWSHLLFFSFVHFHDVFIFLFLSLSLSFLQFCFKSLMCHFSQNYTIIIISS